MSPNRRKKQNRDLPPNLEVDPHGKVTYYRYVAPDGKRESLGKDRAVVIEVTRQLNGERAGSSSIVDRLVAKHRPQLHTSPDNPAMAIVIDELTSTWIPAQNYAQSSLRRRLIWLEEFREQWGSRPIQSVRPVDVAQFLKDQTQEMGRQKKALLSLLFAFAVGQGYLTINPIHQLMRISAPKRKRKRHTWEGYQLVHQAADPWLQIAMDAALYSLQRRSDLVAINVKDHIDLALWTIRIRQRKTDHYNNPVHLLIHMGSELKEVVRKSLRLPPACPFLVHRRSRTTAESRKLKPHPFAVSAKSITDSFRWARDKCGAYDHLEPKLRPTFHDIRALGIFAYHKAGYPVEYIQALAGHATKEMTEHYRQGHEKPEPIRVEAGLSLGQVNWSQVEWETDLPPHLKGLIHAPDQKSHEA